MRNVSCTAAWATPTCRETQKDLNKYQDSDKRAGIFKLITLTHPANFDEPINGDVEKGMTAVDNDIELGCLHGR